MKIAVVYNISRKGIINVFGRQNKEHYSKDEIKAVVKALKQHKNVVETFEGDKSLVDKLEAFMPRVLKGERPGMVFNLAYGIQGESRYTHIPSLLEMLGIPYVGSGPLAHSIALDKGMTKMVLQRAGLPTPAFQVMAASDEKKNRSLHYPLIVKPKDEAVSFGIKVVYNLKQLQEAVRHITSEYKSQAIVEQFLQGREFNIGILGNGVNTELLPVVEVDFGDAGDCVQTYETKKQGTFNHPCPADIPEDLARRLRDLALKTFKTINCVDCSRIDFRLDAKGNPYVLEINSMPAIHRSGSYFIAAQRAGYDYAKMINRMVKVAAARYFGEEDAVKDTLIMGVEGENSLQTNLTDYLRSSSGRMERRLKQLVDCNSHVKNKQGADLVGGIMKKIFTDVGFACQEFNNVEIGNVLLFQNYSGSHKADAMLLCHMDIFYPDWEPNCKFHKHKNRLYGAGIAESKSGLVVIEFALRALKQLKLLRKLKIKILLTTDDGIGNRYSSSIIREQSSSSSRVLSFKLGGPKGQLVTARNGMGFFRANIEGRGKLFRSEEHRVGIDAINELAHKISMWNRLCEPSKDIQVYVTSVRSQVRKGYVPDNAFANIIFLFPRQETGKKLEAQIVKIADKSYVKGSRCRLTGGIERPSFSETKDVKALYQVFAGIADSIGCPVGRIKRYTSSDVSNVPSGTPAIDGLGPVGHNTRTDEEYIESHTLVERTILVSLYLKSLVK
jgi:D-alanine-D-alanine ligase